MAAQHCGASSRTRSEETAAHCEAVLPEVGYRQWTLSLPGRLRLCVVKRPHLHVLVPEGLWADRDFVALPPPEAVVLNLSSGRAKKGTYQAPRLNSPLGQAPIAPRV